MFWGFLNMVRRKKLLYNKKGDLPIVILVIGVFVVCTLTLFNFYFEGFKDENFFKGVILIEKVREFSNDLKFYKKIDLEKDALEYSGLLEKIEGDNFKFEGSVDGKEYKIIGTLFEDLGKGKKLVFMEYNFPK